MRKSARAPTWQTSSNCLGAADSGRRSPFVCAKVGQIWLNKNASFRKDHFAPEEVGGLCARANCQLLAGGELFTARSGIEIQI